MLPRVRAVSTTSTCHSLSLPLTPPTATHHTATGWGSQRSSTHGVSHSGSEQGLPQQRLLAERKWRLGLHMRGHPSAIMAELYRVLAVSELGLRGCETLNRGEGVLGQQEEVLGAAAGAWAAGGARGVPGLACPPTS